MKYLLILLTVLLFSASLFAQTVDTLLYEDWENGIGNWYANNGVWEVGVATAGPDSAFLGQNCAGTILGGNYPSYANTSLISPYINLPNVLGDKTLQLKFMHWFRLQEYSSNYPYPYDPDLGKVRISVNNGAWETISFAFTGFSGVWTQVVLDLTAYADSTIRIAFYFTSTGNNEDKGWYIDEILIERLVIPSLYQEDFEGGVGNWNAENGLWQIGVPTAGPSNGHSGQNVGGIVLNGNYPPYANTRLISSKIHVPNTIPDGKILFKFWQWFKTKEYSSSYPYPYDADKCRVQISVNEGSWQTIAGSFSGASGLWTQVVLDITAYADSTIRIGFYFTSTGNNQDVGWYIDDFSIENIVVPYPFPESFEIGVGNWSTDNGLWQVGVPTAGPSSSHSGQSCVATVLGGDYPPYANTRFISPEITLTPSTGQYPGLYFWHWFRLKEYSSGYPYPYDPDEGYIQISVNGGSWQTIAGPITGQSPVWTQYYVDLFAFADSTVRIAFYFESTGNNQDKGWYIDDIRLEGVTGLKSDENIFTIMSYHIAQNYPNPFNPITHIRYSLPKATDVKIKVYNTVGQEVAVLLDERKPAGTHVVDFDGSNLSSGVYFYGIEAGEYKQVRKMLLVR